MVFLLGYNKIAKKKQSFSALDIVESRSKVMWSLSTQYLLQLLLSLS